MGRRSYSNVSSHDRLAKPRPGFIAGNCTLSPNPHMRARCGCCTTSSLPGIRVSLCSSGIGEARDSGQASVAGAEASGPHRQTAKPRVLTGSRGQLTSICAPGRLRKSKV